MKKSLVAIFIAGLIFVGCSTKSKQQAGSKATSTESVMTPAKDQLKDSLPTNIPTSDNSANALDWPGTYKRTFPCADCEGIETTIFLGKNRLYSITTKYLGKKKAIPHETKGGFRWNKDGNKIELMGIDNAPNKYLVGENKLIQLDL